MELQSIRTDTRVTALDGLRGVTIILVVINHAWILWSRELTDQIPVIRGIFQGGSVVVFFVIGGFIVSLTLIKERERGSLDPLRFYLRRIVRIGVQLVPACLAVVAIHRFDSTDPYSDTATYRSVVNVLTYTWNQYALEHVFEARGDLGHLWYLSVQQQCYLLLPLLIVFSRRRLVLGVVLTLAAVAVVVNRFLVLAADGWFPASLMTTTRSDGLILGVVAALAIRYVARWRDWADRVALLSTVLLLGLLLLSGEIDPLQYLRHWGVAFTLVSVVLVCALHYSSEQCWASRFFRTPALQYLGNASLAIYVWHLIIFETVARHTTSASWQARSVLAFALLAGATYVAQRLIEDPTRRWLKNSPLFRAPIRLSEEGERGIGSEIR
ncbi:acyltransferase family protein [Knoellia sp. LjRoot47]|uniref:acyltransferase family protein n=1 Tax=Knoellia sp. LjRoot47 TaxID=3342330 RepID=UPI003ECD95AF